MMKKNGFTLAEVLITLAIIGVVATMSLPSLMTNTQEQQAKTGLKKAINTLTEAANMNLATENFDYATISGGTEKKGYGDINKDSTDPVNDRTLAYILHNRVQVDYAKIGDELKVGISAGDSSYTQVVPLRDGSALILPNAEAVLPTSYATLNENDNLPVGFTVVYDTNGFKAPNILSNCTGNAAGDDETIESAAKDSDFGTGEEGLNNFKVCGEKGKRVIKDQFLLRLRGTTVQPEGAAATWAFNN